MMSSRPKPVTFSELLISSKYLTVPTTVLKHRSPFWLLWLPFPGFPPCPQMLMFCWIPFLTRASFPVLITGFNHQLKADDSQIPTSSLVISPEHQTPVAICLLSVPTWMSQPSPSTKTCSSSYIPIFLLVLASLLLHYTLPSPLCTNTTVLHAWKGSLSHPNLPHYLWLATVHPQVGREPRCPYRQLYSWPSALDTLY